MTSSVLPQMAKMTEWTVPLVDQGAVKLTKNDALCADAGFRQLSRSRVQRTLASLHPAFGDDVVG